MFKNSSYKNPKYSTLKEVSENESEIPRRAAALDSRWKTQAISAPLLLLPSGRLNVISSTVLDPDESRGGVCLIIVNFPYHATQIAYVIA